jgi:hypothetical protein
MKALNIDELELNHANENTEEWETEEHTAWYDVVMMITIALVCSFALIYIIPYTISKIW